MEVVGDEDDTREEVTAKDLRENGSEKVTFRKKVG